MLEKKIYNLLGKYKVIGDTTYGLGYNEAKELTAEIIKVVKDILPKEKRIESYGSFKWQEPHRGYNSALNNIKKALDECSHGEL